MDIVVLRCRSDAEQVDAALVNLAVQVFSVTSEPRSHHVVDASDEAIVIALRLPTIAAEPCDW